MVSLSATTLLHQAYFDMAARDGPRSLTGRDSWAMRLLAEVVDLKFFCGFSFVEIAAMRDISERTVQRNWEKARIYLHRKIRPDLSL
jgi:hypothetical protein